MGRVRPKMEKGECMKLSQIGKIALPLALAGTLVAGVPLEALACTQVWIPDAYTADQGVWYFGRSEDYSSRYFKIFGVEQAHPKGFLYYSAENGVDSSFKWNAEKPTYRYTFVRDNHKEWSNQPNAYSEAGINEKGVSCSATLTTAYNDQAKAADPSVKSGIGEYDYASVILGQSATAREGVELIGRIIDEKGSCGRDQLIISDNKESWLFCVLSGHQWVAYQLPEDGVSVNPNMSNLRVDLDIRPTSENDPTPVVGKNILCSKDIIKMPKEARAGSFLVLNENGTINVPETYGKADSGNSRYIQGRHFFDAMNGLDYEAADGAVTKLTKPTQFFKPGRSNYTVKDGLNFFAYRGEGTDVDSNVTSVTAIGSQRTTETNFFEIRRGMDPEIATIQWEGLAPGEFNVEIPTYSALLTSVNHRYGDVYMDDAHEGQKNKGVDAALQAGSWDQYLPYVMMDLNTLGDANRAKVAPGLRAYLDAVQNDLIAQHKQVDATMQKTPKAERQALANKAADVAAEQTWAKCEKVLQEVRAYLKGDQAKPFQASDYNAATKGLVTPLAYASSVIPATPDKPVTPAATSIAKAKVSTAKSKYTYTGKALKPKVTVKVAGKTLKANTDYTMSYKANKNVGKATITVTGKGSYTGKVTKTFKIVPKKTGVSKLVKGKKSFTVKWKKQKAQATGYQIRFSTKKSMKSAKVKTVKSAKTTSLKVSKLKGNKKYYVQMRTYKKVKVGGKTTTYYSDWSKAKAVKTRK